MTGFKFRKITWDDIYFGKYGASLGIKDSQEALFGLRRARKKGGRK